MIDIAIITAIYEEYSAVINTLEAAQPVVLPRDNPIPFGWRQGYVASQRYSSPYTVVVAQCPEQTQVPSALATLLTVQQFRPRYVVFCGIAAGINPPGSLPPKERLGLFDILLASTVWGYEYGKLTHIFTPRLDPTFRSDPILKQAAEIFGKSTTGWSAEAEERLRELTLTISRPPHVVVGPVASGDKVVDDISSEFFSAVLQKWPKLRGIEMEGAGAAAAVEMMNSQGINTRYLMIRAVSDVPSTKVESATSAESISERDTAKEGAAIVAAVFLKRFISDSWPIEPFGEIDDPGPGSEGPPLLDNPQNANSELRSQIGNSLGERVIFYMADRELHENSGIYWNERTRDQLDESLLLEFRLAFLSMNTEGTIVFPPTYYLETPAFRKLLAAHVPLIEAGYIKLLLGGPILSDYLDRKRSRYDKAAKFPHYYDAYYSDTKFHGLYDLPFQVTAKSQSIGHKTLASWTRTVLGRSQKHPRLVIRAQHFLDLAETTERSAILFENLREHQHAAGLSDQDALVLDYRSAMNRLYLINYLSLGFTVPETSRFVWDGITWHLPRSGLNLVALTRLAEDLQLKSRILHVDSSKLLTWRTKDTIRILFRSARELLREGKSLTNLVIDLLRRPSTDEIANAFV